MKHPLFPDKHRESDPLFQCHKVARGLNDSDQDLLLEVQDSYLPNQPLRLLCLFATGSR